MCFLAHLALRALLQRTEFSEDPKVRIALSAEGSLIPQCNQVRRYALVLSANRDRVGAPMPRSIACLFLLLATIPAGLAARFAPLHLSWFWEKYLGSGLWAVALYWFIAALLPRLRPLSIFYISGMTAILVELSRLFPEPHIDAFRLTLAGRLLLGRFFSVKNIAAYLLAIGFAALADTIFRPGASNAEAH